MQQQRRERKKAGNSKLSLPSLQQPLLFIFLLLLMWSSDGVSGAHAPLDALAEEVSELKTMLSSIQGSLMTSVRLIQDQLDLLGKQHLTQIDTRLSRMDTRLLATEKNVEQVEERSRAWDTFQQHVNAWADIMTSMDSKVDHLGRTQAEQLASVATQLSAMQTDLGAGIGQITDKLDVVKVEQKRQQQQQPAAAAASHVVTSMDPVAEITSRGVLATLQGIDHKVTALVARNRATVRPNSNGNNNNNNNIVCSELKEAFAEVSSKLERATEEQQQQQHKSHMDDEEEEYSENHPPDTNSGAAAGMEKRLTRLFLRMSAPFKKASRRLKDMDHMRLSFENSLTELSSALDNTAIDVDRKFNDFFNMTMEMFEHQHHQLEEYQLRFAGLDHCCQGTNADVSGLKAGIMPTMDRLDSFLSSAKGKEDSSRVREQLRFDMNRIMAEIRAQGQELMDTCKYQNETKGEALTTTDVVVEKSHGKPAAAAAANTIEVTNEVLRSCEDLYRAGVLTSQPYTFKEEEDTSSRRFCEQSSAGGGWTVILNRGDFNEHPRTNFTRPWSDYKAGFGNLSGEFYLGNEAIHKLTTAKDMDMRVELLDFDLVTVVAEYSVFKVSSEEDKYRLWVSGYTGNASDSLSAHNGVPFSTIDKINDDAPKCCPCAPAYGGGWWFHSCFESNLNGEYHENPTENDYFRGIIWEMWRGDYSLKAARMMIRERGFEVGATTAVPDP